MSGIFLAHCILVPMYICIYYCINIKRMKDKDFNNKVSSFSGDSKLKTSLKAALTVPITFFMESVVLSLSLVFIEDFVWGQMACNFCIQTVILIWFCHNEPYETKSENRLTNFIHLMTLYLLTLMMCYTDFVPSAETRY